MRNSPNEHQILRMWDSAVGGPCAMDHTSRAAHRGMRCQCHIQPCPPVSSAPPLGILLTPLQEPYMECSRCNLAKSLLDADYWHSILNYRRLIRSGKTREYENACIVIAKVPSHMSGILAASKNKYTLS